jgi:crotonobetainyl-CoA:carnitine CoA-transferase CaiB-like acyl-CoA transferase
VQGILAALLVRECDGLGQRVGVSLLQALLTAQAYRIICDPELLELPAFDDTVPYQAFRAQDGQWLVVAVVSAANWRALCESLGDAELAADPRFAANPERVEHRDELVPRLRDHFARRPARAWIELLEEAGVPCAPVQTLAELLADPATLAAGVIANVEHRTAGTLRTLGTPIDFSRTPARAGSPTPGLGEHTAEVLAELALDWRVAGPGQERLRQ